MSSKHSYHGNLQERLRNLSIRTNCPTRQENGQRYLGPPVNWIEKAPTNAEIFISKLPADCYEDEIYDFCCRVGKIYLIRLMINFENENRGFCFVTFSSAKEAEEAVVLLPQNPLRKGHYVHAEISFNNCTLKMYGLDFRWNDENLEQEIRTNTKDVVNVTIKRNMAQRTLMATLYFDTHQKAAIARRKLSQIANSRWGQNVKVFLWSKKLQNKGSMKQDSPNEKNYSPRKKSSERYDDELSTKDSRNDFDTPFIPLGPNEDYKSPSKSFTPENLSPFPDFSSPWSNQSLFSSSKQYNDFDDKYQTSELFPKPDNVFDFNNNKFSSMNHFKKMDASVGTFDGPNFELFSSCESTHTFGSAFGTPPSSSYCTQVTNDSPMSSLFPFSNESSPGGCSNSNGSDTDFYSIYGTSSWNNDNDRQFAKSYFNDTYESNQFTSSLYPNVPEKQIETILQEALEALVLNKCDENDHHQFFL